MEQGWELSGRELKPVSYFFCVLFPGKSNLFDFSPFKKTLFCGFCQFLDDLPPPDPASIISLRMSWASRSKSLDERSGSLR